MIKNAPLELVDKETVHLPTPGRTLNRSMILQTNILYRVHVLHGFVYDRYGSQFWDVLYAQHHLPIKLELIRCYTA